MMGADITDGPDEPDQDPGFDERPYGTRPYGTRPYGTRPYGTRPYGTRPYGTRPYGTRPYGTRPEDDLDERPYGTRPYGTRPYGTRPYGTRPYGTRPYGTRPYGTRDDDGALDRDEWADDIAELFCAASAVVSLGASIVFADCDAETPVPSIEDTPPVADYLQTRRGLIDPKESSPPTSPENPAKPAAPVYRRILRPRDHELAVKAVLSDDLARDIAERPELAWPLKQDLADDLALAADRAFLSGAAPQPLGIAGTAGVIAPPLAGLNGIETFRALLTAVRAAGRRFRAPGFVLSPATFDALVNAIMPADMPPGRLDLTRLLTYDSKLLFGYPYAITRAAGNRVYFSADWGEAWIAFDRRIVTIDLSTEAHFQTDETVVRAVSRHDFLLRRPTAFAHMEWVPPNQ
jgi:hypothetical protein